MTTNDNQRLYSIEMQYKKFRRRWKFTTIYMLGESDAKHDGSLSELTRLSLLCTLALHKTLVISLSSLLWWLYEGNASFALPRNVYIILFPIQVNAHPLYSFYSNNECTTTLTKLTLDRAECNVLQWDRDQKPSLNISPFQNNSTCKNGMASDVVDFSLDGKIEKPGWPPTSTCHDPLVHQHMYPL